MEREKTPEPKNPTPPPPPPSHDDVPINGQSRSDDVPEVEEQEQQQQQDDNVAEEAEEEYNYDDDEFEDYDDDDFEEDEDEEDEEEEKLDSGNFDKRSALERARMEQEMREVKQAMIRENSARHPRARRAAAGEPSSDKSDDSGKGSSKEEEDTTSRAKRGSGGGGFINFSSAKARQKTQVAAGRARRRGDELLTMIRLDVVAFDLMELPPIRYEAFMKTFGATNTMQAMAQTGEDNLEEEVQTEPVEMLDKWTQKPPAAVGFKSADGAMDREIMLENIRGVGGQTSAKDGGASSETSWEFSSRSDSMRLSKFLSAAGPALLTLLEEEAVGEGPEGQVTIIHI